MIYETFLETVTNKLQEASYNFFTDITFMFSI